MREKLREAERDTPPAAETLEKLCIRKISLETAGVTLDMLRTTPNLLVDEDGLIVLDKKVLESIAGMTYEKAIQKFIQD